MEKVMMLTTTAYMSERFNRSNIEILENMGYEVHVVANFDKGNPSTYEVLSEFKSWIENHHGKWFSISVTKHPFDIKNNIKAYRQILNLINLNHYKFIHCHTPVAGCLGRFVAKATNTKVIYTAHGFHFYKGAPLKNWLLYYPVEWICSWWTDMLITINKEDYERAKNKMHARAVEYIPGVGIDTSKYTREEILEKLVYRKSINIPDGTFILTSVGELNKNKNHDVIIKALKKVNNPRIHYIIAGEGKRKSELEKLASKYGVNKQVHLIGYCKNVSALYRCSDVCVFPSIREGLGLAAIEGMAAGLPLICSSNRGTKSYAVDKENAYVCQYNDVNGFTEAITMLYCNPALRKKWGKENIIRSKLYDIENINEKMTHIYELFR